MGRQEPARAGGGRAASAPAAGGAGVAVCATKPYTGGDKSTTFRRTDERYSRLIGDTAALKMWDTSIPNRWSKLVDPERKARPGGRQSLHTRRHV